MWVVIIESSIGSLEKHYTPHAIRRGAAKDIQALGLDPPNPSNDGHGTWYAILTQPGGTVHAPYSPENVMYTGTHHVLTLHLVDAMAQAVREAENPGITNDDHEVE
ncbi:hypothetical protein PG993_006510 [Apiospora rasikravindrae]|uniref:Uncharacterized protein n=1 Tax=Apiospora rasikravindrae TaxID=990691 RepID=A0ABR1T5X7_9PEZI